MAVESMNPGGVVSVMSDGTYDQGLDSRETDAQVETVSAQLAWKMPVGGFPLTDAEFFSRPVDLVTFSWIAGTSVLWTNQVWRTWTAAPMILNRLAGRSYWRGNLVLLIEFNPGPYHYGLLRFYAHPFRASGLDTILDLGGTDTSFQCVQMVGIDIDPAIPGAKKLKLPWISPRPATKTHGGTTDSFFTQHVVSAFPIVSLSDAASVSAGSVPIRVRAWMEDFESFGPTAIAAVAQADIVRKEKTRGLLSAYTGPMEAAATALSKAPGTIGGIAASAGAALKGGNSILHLLGLSRPADQVISNVTRVPPSMARTDVNDSVSPVTYTAAQSLTADGSDLGRAQDEMMLSTIFGTQSYLHSMGWTTGQAAGTPLAVLSVHPMASMRSGTTVYPTSLAFGCMPFLRWRGSIIYTIAPVCSQFHRGQLRISYDPNGGSGGAGNNFGFSGLENCILDLSPGCKAEVKVNFSSPDYWKGIYPIFTAPTTTAPEQSHIGNLTISVEMPLLAPLSTSGVTVVVYVRAGPDFEVFGTNEFVPDISFKSGVFSMLTPPTGGTPAAPSSFAPPDEKEEADEAFIAQIRSRARQPVIGDSQSALTSTSPLVRMCEFGGAPVPPPTSFTYGERIVSLRSLLKRYALLGFITPSSDPNSTKFSLKSVQSVLPLHPPCYPISFLTGAGTGGGVGIAGTSRITLFNWFKLGYVGMRGSARYRLVDPAPDSCIINLGANQVTTAFPDTTFLAAPCQFQSTYLAASVSSRDTATGDDATLGYESSSLSHAERASFEVPDYNCWSYRPCRYWEGRILSTDGAGRVTGYQWNDTFFRISKSILDMSKTSFLVYHSVGDDFSFLYWNGPPVLYYSS